jgi:trk system potassium uptake protein
MQEKYAVIGLGLLGTGIAKNLAKRGGEVIVIDTDEDKVELMKDEVAHSVVLDSTDIKALRSQNIHEVDAAVVAIGHNFEVALLTTVMLQELGVKRIITRVSNKHQKMILNKIGITEVFAPDEEIGKTIAEKLIHPDIKGYLSLPDDFEIVELKTPRRAANKSVSEVNLRERYNLSLITLKRQFQEVVNGARHDVEHIIGNPTKDTVLLESDTLILLGKAHDVDKFIEINK